MSADGNAWGMCAAYGCPMFGSFGVGGKWYCCCHFRANAGTNDAITLVLNMNSSLVKESLLIRREGGRSADLRAIEDKLVELTAEAGRQEVLPTAPIIGPTHAMQHYTDEQ
jgi:hypothetical protein